MIPFNIAIKIRGFLFRYKTPKDLSPFNCSLREFSTKINKMEYKADPFKGAIDYTASVDTFFKRKKFGRDCDDYARMWFTFGVLNNYKATEIVVANNGGFFLHHLHVVTILFKDGEYILCNYRLKRNFTSFEDAINSLKSRKSYSSGLIWAIELESKKCVII